MCECLCVSHPQLNRQTHGPLDLNFGMEVKWKISRSSLKVKVIGQMSRSPGQKTDFPLWSDVMSPRAQTVAHWWSTEEIVQGYDWGIWHGVFSKHMWFHLLWVCPPFPDLLTSAGINANPKEYLFKADRPHPRYYPYTPPWLQTQRQTP